MHNILDEVSLTSDLYSLKITSLLIMVLLIIPNILMAFFDASVHCLDDLLLLWTIIPRSLSS